MLITHYYAVALFAAALTAAWLFQPRSRTQITTFGAMVAWTLVALLGDQTTVFDPAIEEVVTTNNSSEIAVQTAGRMVEAPVPDEVRLFAGLWGLLSALALILHIMGVYPPAMDQDNG